MKIHVNAEGNKISLSCGKNHIATIFGHITEEKNKDSNDFNISLGRIVIEDNNIQNNNNIA